jgi:hypothetical protein
MTVSTYECMFVRAASNKSGSQERCTRKLHTLVCAQTDKLVSTPVQLFFLFSFCMRLKFVHAYAHRQSVEALYPCRGAGL